MPLASKFAITAKFPVVRSLKTWPKEEKLLWIGFFALSFIWWSIQLGDSKKMEGLSPYLNTIIFGTIAYAAIVFILRISGKRTLAKWNSFDFVVTIAFGSILSSILLSTEKNFGTGLVAFTLLVLFQFSITWIAVRSSAIQKLIKAEPALLLYQGEMQHDVLKRERVAEGEVLAALRSSGVSAIEEAGAVVLETDGSFSVIPNVESGSFSALKDVKEFDRTKMAEFR